MIQVRNGIFETNSSSVHALVFFTKDQYDGLVNGDLYYDRWTGKVLTEDEALAEGMNEEGFLPHGQCRQSFRVCIGISWRRRLL